MLHLLPLWAQLTCGGCGRGFTGNARSVPNWNSAPACPSCWRRVNDLRTQLGLAAWDTPTDAYPIEGDRGDIHAHHLD